MNSLHINQSDVSGGAAIAAHRLHKALLTQNINSRLLVDQKQSDSNLIAKIPRRRYLDSLSSRLAYYVGLNYVNHTSTYKITNHPFYLEADILNFHNLHGDYFNYLALPKLTKQKPAVLTLHDMWSFTGHCAYSLECDFWQTGCGKCPHLDSYPAICFDNTHIEWLLKKWTYHHSRLTIVSPSAWLAKLAKSSLLNRFDIHIIPNGVDIRCYRPLDKVLCRKALDIPWEKKVLLFAAQSLKDPRKGSDLLISSLANLPASLKQEIIILVFGESSHILESVTEIPTIALGYIGGERLKAVAYSSADLFLFSTRADNLPLVLQESMACGTPMVSFCVGGVPEIVRPYDTGLLAEAENTHDFSQKIVELLEDHELHQRMSAKCRSIAVEEYSLTLQAKRYANLYVDLTTK